MKVIRKNGTEYDLANYGIKMRRFSVASPETIHSREQIEGRDGFIDMGTTYGGRSITVECFMSGADALDFHLLRNEVFRIFDSREAFYIVSDAEPAKRWLVKYDGSFSMQQTLKHGEFTLEFISPSSYAESIGTTLDLFTFEDETWQVGQGLTEDMSMTVEYATTWRDIGDKKWSEL
jgi:phage-related protein